MNRYFVSDYTDGPATRWNVIDRKTQDVVGVYPTEAKAYENAQARINQENTQTRIAELVRIKDRLDTIFNNVLCDMRPGWDDSIEGFNKAWDVARDIFKDEIERASR